jgi:hypothetical protein
MDSRNPSAGRPRIPPRRATAAAVLGSVAALGGTGTALAQSTGHPPAQRAQSRRADKLPPGELALLGLVFGALSAAAPAIAKPILARGVGDGTINQAEEDGFLARLASVKGGDGSRPTAGAGRVAAPAAGPPSPAAQALFQRVFAAIRAELPVIAAPLVATAVADGTISQAQAVRLTGRFAQGPRLGFGLVMRARAVPATRLP